MTFRGPIRHLASRCAMAAISSLCLTAAFLAAAWPAQAAQAGGRPADPFAPSYHHPYRHGAVPTLAAWARIRQWSAAHHVPRISANNLTYGGGVDGIGVTTGHEKVYLVFYGSQWGTTGTDGNGNTTLSGDLAGEAPYLQQMFKGLGTANELWSGVMTQYCDGVAFGSQSCPPSSQQHAGYPAGGALAGVWVDEHAASPVRATGHQLAAEAVAAAGHFGNTTAGGNRSAQYVILSPPGTNPDGFNLPGSQFCAWHDFNGDSTLTGGAAVSPYGDVAFTNLPYLTDAGPSCGQGFVNSGGGGLRDGISIVAGHEYAETVTDQNPAGGWTDGQGYENGDKCAWLTPGTLGGSFDLTTATGVFAMQTTWANDGNGGSGACEASHPIVANGGTNTVTVTNPGNQTGAVGTAVSLQIHATDSASGQTLSYSATGLPAGLTIGAATGLISGTPTTAVTASVTVTARDGTSAAGSAVFSWTITAGGGGGCQPAQLLGNPGFESGVITPWTASPGVLASAAQGVPPHSGSWLAWLGGYRSPHTDSLAQTVTIPSGCHRATLSFWLWVSSTDPAGHAYDTLKVQVLNSGGAVLATLATYSNQNSGHGYSQQSFPLNAYIGQTITLKFTAAQTLNRYVTSFLDDDNALTVS